MFEPKNDGIDHINVYTKGATELGRLLSNLSTTPFDHQLGTFQSMEGFWYYYLTGCKHESLIGMDGFQAKKFGKELKNDRIDKDGLTDSHKADIIYAIRCKLKNNMRILQLMKESGLPFTHYYYYGTVDNPKIVYLPQFDWMLNYYERVREYTKEKFKYANN